MLINFYWREGVEVTTYNPVAFNEIGGDNGFIVAHCEVIADGQNGEVEPWAQHGDEFHIHGEAGVAGEVKATLVVVDYKAARVAAIRTVWQTTTVCGVYVFHRTKIKIILAAMVHAVGSQA